MSYPALYLGDEGQISAKYMPAGEPDLAIGSRASVRYLAQGASTNGQFGLYRWDILSRGPGPTPHFHKTMSESFFVLSGTVRLHNGERWIDASPGDFLYVPPGGIHAFHNDTDEPASMLIVFAPGIEREPYFEALAEIAAGRQLSEEEWANVCVKYDNYFIDAKSRSIYQTLLSENR